MLKENYLGIFWKFIFIGVLLILVFFGQRFYFDDKNETSITILEEKIEDSQIKQIKNEISETKKENKKREIKNILYSVPFIPQAPFAEWDNLIFQNGCEEASVIMAVSWIKNEGLDTKTARRKIIELSEWEKKQIGQFVDTSIKDTNELFLSRYFEIKNGAIKEYISLDDVKEALLEGIIIVPVNGRSLKNPNFKQPGPLTHMLVIIGYDAKKKEFIVNDPGTRHGDGYRYDESVLFESIRDYPTGKHLPIYEDKKTMLIIK